MRERLLKSLRAAARWLLDRQRRWNVDEYQLYRQLRRSVQELDGHRAEIVGTALERSAEAIRDVYDRVDMNAPMELSRSDLRRLYGSYVIAFALLASPPDAREGIVDVVAQLPLDTGSVVRTAAGLEKVERGDTAAAGASLARLLADSVPLPAQYPPDFWQVLVANQLAAAARP